MQIDCMLVALRKKANNNVAARAAATILRLLQNLASITEAPVQPPNFYLPNSHYVPACKAQRSEQQHSRTYPRVVGQDAKETTITFANT